MSSGQFVVRGNRLYTGICLLAVLFSAAPLKVMADATAKAHVSLPSEPSAALMRWVGQYGSPDSLLTIYEDHGRLCADGMELHRVALACLADPETYSVRNPGSARDGSTMKLVLEHEKACRHSLGPRATSPN